MRRVIRLESSSLPMRIATSNGSATRSTGRGSVEFERDAGIVSREIPHDRREVKTSEGDRKRNPQDPAWLLKHRSELFVREPCLVDDPLAPFKIEPPRRAQSCASCGVGASDCSPFPVRCTSRQSGAWHARVRRTRSGSRRRRRMIRQNYWLTF